MIVQTFSSPPLHALFHFWILHESSCAPPSPSTPPRLPRTLNLKSLQYSVLQYSVQQYHQFSSKRLSLLDVVIRINIFKSSQIVFDRAFRNVPILLVCCLLCLLKHCVQSKRSIDRSVEAHTTENILDAKNCYYNNTMILLYIILIMEYCSTYCSTPSSPLWIPISSYPMLISPHKISSTK